MGYGGDCDGGIPPQFIGHKSVHEKERIVICYSGEPSREVRKILEVSLKDRLLLLCNYRHLIDYGVVSTDVIIFADADSVPAGTLHQALSKIVNPCTSLHGKEVTSIEILYTYTSKVKMQYRLYSFELYEKYGVEIGKVKAWAHRQAMKRIPLEGVNSMWEFFYRYDYGLIKNLEGCPSFESRNNPFLKYLKSINNNSSTSVPSPKDRLEDDPLIKWLRLINEKSSTSVSSEEACSGGDPQQCSLQ